MPKISIVVPVYNIEKYLDKCVQSILDQTFTDTEIILVDDGSSDSSGKMCDQWKEKDSRIVVIHKENGGLSDARNVGIAQAKSEYIGLVDGDDFIKPDMFEILYRNIRKTKADISMCGFADYYQSGVRNDCDDKNTIYKWNQEETIQRILIGKQQSVHAVTKLYKKSLFDKAKYPYGKVNEDAFIIMDILDQIQTAVYTPYAGYYYVHRAGSICTGTYKPSDKARLEAYEKNLKYIQKNWPHLESYAQARYLDAHIVLADKMVLNHLSASHPDHKLVFSYMRRHYIRALVSPAIKLGKKIRITLMLLNEGLYRKYAGKVSGQV
ncbi:MAG: glycosyltransferase [Oscillospiraceae bacterium]|nr:glycosyltransferase [Oscillospiraceae bacterium]